MLKNRILSELYTQHAHNEADCPRYQKKTRDSSHRSHCATQPCADTYRDADNIRAGHELAEAHNIGKVLLTYPPLLIDSEAPRPDKPASTADPVQRDLQ